MLAINTALTQDRRCCGIPNARPSRDRLPQTLQTRVWLGKSSLWIVLSGAMSPCSRQPTAVDQSLRDSLVMRSDLKKSDTPVPKRSPREASSWLKSDTLSCLFCVSPGARAGGGELLRGRSRAGGPESPTSLCLVRFGSEGKDPTALPGSARCNEIKLSNSRGWWALGGSAGTH